MKYVILLACGMVIVSLPIDGAANERSCMSDHDLQRSLAALSSPETKPDLHRQILIRNARKSPKCRTQVIAALLHRMNKPDLNLERDQQTFFLWHYGGEVLGALRASEALDLLIANLGVTDGESPNMTHYPAVETVIRIGPIAIPKLGEKLQHDERAGMRKLAVFCIGTIGGASAKRVLEDALPKERDKCVNDFIRLTLKSFGNRQRPNHIATDDFVKWFTSLFCV
jgi:hypothetical protein